ncbi:MAG TPA: trigger factor, partial [Vampirovibrionales bacterium]
MKTQIENIEKNKAKLIIEFEPKESRKAYNIVLKDIAKDADIPGFRKGKIPLSIIEERVGKQGVEMEAIKKLVEDHLPKVIESEKLELLTSPALESQEFETFDNVKLTIALETRPDVKLANYKELEFTIPKAEPEDVTPESLVEDLAKRVSPWKDATEDAIAELGNLLTFDFEGEFADGSDMPDKEGKDMRVIAEPDNFAPGVIEELVGMKVGENKTIKSVFPKDYDDEAFAGKEASFKVSLKK